VTRIKVVQVKEPASERVEQSVRAMCTKLQTEVAVEQTVVKKRGVERTCKGESLAWRILSEDHDFHQVTFVGPDYWGPKAASDL
jgi:hypothetical protein